MIIFSNKEIRSLSQARSDTHWVELPDGIPPAIFQKILEHRSGKLEEIERRASAGTTILLGGLHKRQEESDGEGEPNDNGCTCDCDSCVGDDCLSCSDEFCDDPACEDFRTRAEMKAHLAAISAWLS